MSTSSVPPPFVPSQDATSRGVVHVRRDGEVLTATLDRPDAGNEISAPMFETLLALLGQEAASPSARVLRLRANGAAFCTGRERAGRDVRSVRAESARLIELKRLLRRTSLVTIAEVQGDALGFGFGLAILCDFPLVVERAVLAFPEMRAGLAPAAILAYLGEYALPRHAFPLVLFGEPIPPRRAREIGLISDVFADAGALRAAADELTARILRLDPVATRRCKELFGTMLAGSFDANCRLAIDTLTVGSLSLLER
jgi:methylglutaconyl-CoA hydratase